MYSTLFFFQIGETIFERFTIAVRLATDCRASLFGGHLRRFEIDSGVSELIKLKDDFTLDGCKPSVETTCVRIESCRQSLRTPTALASLQFR